MMDESLDLDLDSTVLDQEELPPSTPQSSYPAVSPSHLSGRKTERDANKRGSFPPPKPTVRNTISPSKMPPESHLSHHSVTDADSTHMSAEVEQDSSTSSIPEEDKAMPPSRESRLYRKRNKHLKVLTDLGRRRYERREPYQWISRPSDSSSVSDDSVSNGGRQRRFNQQMSLPGSNLTANTLDLEMHHPTCSVASDMPSHPSVADKNTLSPPSQSLFEGKTYSHEEYILIERFWKAYDEILILSLFSILGISFRLLFAQWFSTFDTVFNENSALFTNLPLNCFSCWLMGFLCSGQEALDIVFKRMGSGISFTVEEEDATKTKNPTCNQQDGHSDITPPRPNSPIVRRITETLKRVRSDSPSRRKRESTMRKNKLAQAEMREVQLLALERRIRASPSLVLFPAKKQDIDVIEHYAYATEAVNAKSFHPAYIHHGIGSSANTEIYTSKLSHAWKTFSTVNIADGWDVGTTADAMKEGILLGLRVGFCGALSSFSSWNSDMVYLLCNKNIDAAIVGYMLGLLLPIVSYRTGQHSAVYLFVWRCRRETMRDERRGTQLKLSLDDDEDDLDPDNAVSGNNGDENGVSLGATKKRKKRAKNDGGRILDEEAISRHIPSIRALVTAISCTILIGFISSLVFYAHDDAIVSTSWSLLFSPMGGFARRMLTLNLNNYFQSFPLGSFACNMLGCALSGGLGAIIAGNPDPGEHIALISSIYGFAGSLSAFTSFLIEVLERIDPILLNSDGILYALWTIFSALIIGILSSQTKDWADRIG